MTVHIHLCTVIDAPPEAVWAELEQVEHHVDWMADAEKITFRSEQTRGVGTEIACLTRIGPLHTTDVLRFTAWTPPHTMGIEHTGVVTGNGSFDLTRAPGDRAEMCWDERLTFPWWMGGPVGELAARPFMHRIWRGNLRRLAARVTRAG
ncbi:MAG: Polyketide cyclase / dehydrase and lipid transport [Actinomycetia bacterium]|nr:Polyketide cyclase / dehydrase and lipid transport [Actinomycetes bacterium]